MVATSRQGSNATSGSGEHALEKRSLASILREHGKLSVADAVDITLDVCDVLARAHANGVVHGDLGLHRVRTTWPRIPGRSVDIFALDDDDSAAFTFRSSAGTDFVAPERRRGRVVDVRADVWAVGAMLHWMIAGASARSGLARAKLASAPGSLIDCIEACLSEDPAKRPASVDVLAETLSDFSTAPMDRFEQLARRRAIDAQDRAVLAREAEAGAARRSEQPPISSGVRSVVQENSTLTALVDDEMNIETTFVKPRHAAPASSTSALTAPADPAPNETAVALAMADASRPFPWTTVLSIVGTLVLGIAIGMRVMSAPPAASSAPAAPSAPAMTAARPATPSPSARAIVGPNETRLATPNSLPNAPVTPASLPDVPRPEVRRPAPVAPAAAAPTAMAPREEPSVHEPSEPSEASEARPARAPSAPAPAKSSDDEPASSSDD